MKRHRFTLEGIEIQHKTQCKCLGILVDQQLDWKVQTAAVISKGAKWVALFCRLARINTGMPPKLMKRMFNAVAIPKMAYALDIWYTPVHLLEGAKKRVGLVVALREMTKIQ